MADVVDVESPAALAGHIAEIGPGEQRVLRLESATYEVENSFFLPSGREIAVLGTGETILDGTVALGGAGSQIYLSRVELSSDDLAFNSQGEGSEFWFDDSVSTSVMALDGESHLRRSSVWTDEPSPFGEGALFTYGAGASLYMENTAIGPSAYPGLIVRGGEVDIRYSTIAGVSTAVACNTASGMATSGTIRNSIILGEAAPAIDAECDGLTWSNNAVNEPGFGTQVGDYEATWFASGEASRLLLSNAGEAVFDGIAQWEEGDPERDVEGDLRPQDGPGFPGVDEP